MGQDCSHATEQSHGQSLATAQHDQTQCPKPTNKTIVKQDEQPQDEPNVHAVMVPMLQQVGGWHMTSMTKPQKEQNVPHPCPRLLGPNSLFFLNLVSAIITPTQFIVRREVDCITLS